MAALGAILNDAKLEPAFIALTLSPPSEADIAREIGGDVDPDAVFAARRKLRAAIGARHGAALADTYQRMITPGPYRPDAQSAGRRALKNVCLDLLAMTEADEAIARAFAQYQSADNMTDRMAALETLALHDRPERAAALDDFYKRYADDPLIIDKWLALQAAIPEPATLDRVRALTKHPAFSVANPNRIRALIGSFAQVNHTQFNRGDGAGYDFRRRLRARARPEEPASGGAADGRLPLLARARSQAPRAKPKPRSAASPPRRRCRATSTTSSRARWPTAEPREPSSLRHALKSALAHVATLTGRDRRPWLNDDVYTLSERCCAPSQVIQRARLFQEAADRVCCCAAKNLGIILKKILTSDSRQISAHRFY